VLFVVFLDSYLWILLQAFYISQGKKIHKGQEGPISVKGPILINEVLMGNGSHPDSHK
jgi:hypothetical protein